MKIKVKDDLKSKTYQLVKQQRLHIKEKIIGERGTVRICASKSFVPWNKDTRSLTFMVSEFSVNELDKKSYYQFKSQ